MRLIKKGKPYARGEKEVKCAKCNSVYTYTKADERILYSDLESVGTGVTCPECGESKLTSTLILSDDPW